MKQILLLISSLILSLTMALSQQTGQQSLAMLKESPAGSKIIRYMDVLNSGEPITEEHITQLFSQNLVKKHG